MDPMPQTVAQPDPDDEPQPLPDDRRPPAATRSAVPPASSRPGVITPVPQQPPQGTQRRARADPDSGSRISRTGDAAGTDLR